MRLYESGLEYIYDELVIMEKGLRLLLADFESKELEGQTPMSMRGLIVNSSDIERSLQENENLEEEDALGWFRQARLEAEAEIARVVNAGISEGRWFPLASLSWELRLSAWEKRCVLLCLASELDARYESWFGYLNDDVTLRAPTLMLALRLLGDSDDEDERIAARGLLAGHSTLSRYLLRQEKAAADRSSLSQPLRLDSRIITFLLETEKIDSRIADIAEMYGLTEPAIELWFDADIQLRLREALQRERERQSTEAAAGNGFGKERVLPFIQLHGSQGAGKKLQARHLAEGSSQSLLVVQLDKLARDNETLTQQLKNIVREAIISEAMLCFDEGDGGTLLRDDWGLLRERVRGAAADYADIASWPAVIWLAGQERRAAQLPMPENPAYICERIPVPPAEVRLMLWQRYSCEEADQEALHHVANKYAFTAGQIKGTCMQAERQARWNGRLAPSLADYAEASRMQVQHRLNELAEKQLLIRKWEDIVLPEEQHQLLRDACNRYKYSETVLNRWDFGHKLPYGKGLSMLFAGPPGTGKTMAAEVMAGELGLELYRIDLSRIVSKYIGETEKNLRELFAEAENSGAILFFDEGDSLFGKRTEIKDSNDRFANMEAAYLLQRIETFNGVSILATNLLQNMDEAFMRRMQVIVKFPFPDAAQREQIFRTLLPKAAPLDEDLDLAFLASRVDVSGGHIKNIVLSAAYMAAADQSAIGMRHMIRAARQELHKIGKIVVKEAFEPFIDR